MRAAQNTKNHRIRTITTALISMPVRMKVSARRFLGIFMEKCSLWLLDLCEGCGFGNRLGFGRATMAGHDDD